MLWGQWVSEYDIAPVQPHENLQKNVNLPQYGNFFGYNVWGFKDDNWRNLVVPGDPNQPLIKMFELKYIA